MLRRIKRKIARHLLRSLLRDAESKMTDTFDRRLSARIDCLNFLIQEHTDA
jgi:hypothetical protein